MNKVREFVASGYGKAAVAVASVAVVLAIPGIAAADSVDDGFTSIQTQLTGYLGDAVALVLAIVGLAVGIRMLVRWAKRASAS